MTCAEGATVLALYPTSRGFGFALFHGEESLIDWGIKDIRWKNKNFLTLHLVKALIDRYAPDVIVIEDSARNPRRHERIRILHNLISAHAKSKKIAVRRFTQGAMHEHFGVETKYGVAEAVARAMPMLAPRLPPKRKAWMSEDARQSLFDAVALGIVYFASVARTTPGSGVGG